MSASTEHQAGMGETTGGTGPNGDSSKGGLPAEPAACGPGCNCAAPARGGIAKVVICLVVLLAVVGIIAYKALGGRGAAAASPAANDKAGFNVPPAMKVEDVKAAPLKEADKEIGKYLKSMSELNTVAIDQDAVFIFVPATDTLTPSDATRTAVLAAQKTLGAKDTKVGLYTLQAMSADQAQIAKQVKLPAVLVACKGRGMGVVSGEVTETKLLQAYMASSQAGGCGPASAGCGPSGCP
jgi:hypothetical protein